MKLSQNLKILLVSISSRFPSGLIRSTLRAVCANGFVVKQHKEVAREIVEGIEH
jgi:hypothetical protein